MFIKSILLVAMLSAVQKPVECEQPRYAVKVAVDFGKYADTGTGSLVRHDLIISAYHVVAGDTEKTPIYITFRNGEKVEAEVIKSADNQDLVLLRIPSTLRVPIKIGRLDMEKGEQVVISGWALGKDYKRLESRVHEWYKFDQDGKDTAFSVKGVCISGMSGGPAVRRGRLVGVLTGADDVESYCSDLKAIKKLLKEFDLAEGRRKIGVGNEED